jgi:hypothetical protein
VAADDFVAACAGADANAYADGFDGHAASLGSVGM